jgi:lipid-binding SYLF domain-containing protein
MSLRRVFLALSVMIAIFGTAHAGPREEARLLEATQVLVDTQSMPDGSIPDWLLQRAQGIAIIPSVVKVGLMFGGQGGKGLLTVRDPHGRWSNPVFVTMGGGSWGLQLGVQVSDVILVFTTRRSIEGVTGGKLTLGAGASVAAGPVGRQASAATDIGGSEVYSYSRSKGLFAGIAVDGSVIAIDGKANGAYYQRPGVLASEIMSPSAPAAPATAGRLLEALRKLPSGGDTAPSSPSAPPVGTPASAPLAPAQAPADGRGLESGGATTYPMNDPKRPL